MSTYVGLSNPSFSLLETLGWMIDHTDVKKCTVNSEKGECVGVFLPVEVQKYYKLRDRKETLNT
jgi:hypothetical protein